MGPIVSAPRSHLGACVGQYGRHVRDRNTFAVYAAFDGTKGVRNFSSGFVEWTMGMRMQRQQTMNGVRMKRRQTGRHGRGRLHTQTGGHGCGRLDEVNAHACIRMHMHAYECTCMHTKSKGCSRISCRIITTGGGARGRANACARWRCARAPRRRPRPRRYPFADLS